jgi:hypothetical protein
MYKLVDFQIAPTAPRRPISTPRFRYLSPAALGSRTTDFNLKLHLTTKITPYHTRTSSATSAPPSKCLA